MQSTDSILQGALALAERGYKVFPVGANKQPSVEGGFYAATDNPAVIRAWADSGQLKNIGIATGALSGVCVTDADTEEARDRLRREYGPETVTSARGAHWWWRHPGYKVASKPLGGGVDSKADGGYVLAPPSTGKHWANGLPEELAPMPEGVLPQIRVVTQTTAIAEDKFEAAAQVLAENYPEPGDQYEAGRHLAGYLMGNGVSREDGTNLVLEALSRSYGLDKDSEYNIDRVFTTTESRLAAGEHVTGGPSLEEYVPGLTRKIAEALDWKAKNYPLTDAGNAERFADAFGAEHRFAPELNKWLRFDGRRWVVASADPAWGMIETVRKMHAEAAELEPEARDHLQKFARASERGERIREALKLAKGRLAVNVSDFDTDPYILNVENGTIDLRTGKLRAHNRDDMLMKMAPVEYDPNAKAPLFHKFIKQTLVDPELASFVQRFMGYSLTGSTKERTLAVLYGVGKNGKSTLVELFQDLLGDYSATTSPDTVMSQKFSTSREYSLAQLAGVRFLSISETKRGAELDEAVVKQITGGDTIHARAIYGSPFTYRPQFTIWMSTNHKPEIPDGSEAIWDRMRLIPFTQRFEGKRADADLPEKLRKELSGILAWAVKGCVAWHAQGLGTSKAVEDATAKYRSETDVIDRFFSDECAFGPELTVARTELFEAWERWCDAEGEDAGLQRDFTSKVQERGITRGFGTKKVKGTRIWSGLGLAIPPSGGSSAPSQNTCKQGGITTSGGQSNSDSLKVFLDDSRKGTSSEKADSVPPVPPSEDTPLNFGNWKINNSEGE